MPTIVFAKLIVCSSNTLRTWTSFCWEKFNSYLWQEFSRK